MTPAVWVVRAELRLLAAELADLPHAPACPGGPGCWCPLADVAALLADRINYLEAGSR